MMDWQPIETAPKDGTLVLVHGGMAYWRDDTEGWYTVTGHDWPGKPIQWEVTEWMPFPSSQRNQNEH